MFKQLFLLPRKVKNKIILIFCWYAVVFVVVCFGMLWYAVVYCGMLWYAVVFVVCFGMRWYVQKSVTRKKEHRKTRKANLKKVIHVFIKYKENY